MFQTEPEPRHPQGKERVEGNDEKNTDLHLSKTWLLTLPQGQTEGQSDTAFVYLPYLTSA